MEVFFLSVMSSAMVAAVLAVAVTLLGMRLRRPVVLHLLWVIVLVKLFVPPVFEFALLPVPSAGEVAVEGAVAGVAGAPAELASLGLGSWTVVGWSFPSVRLWPSSAARKSVSASPERRCSWYRLARPNMLWSVRGWSLASTRLRASSVSR